MTARNARPALRAADLDAELIVPLGGASVGERDLLQAAYSGARRANRFSSGSRCSRANPAGTPASTTDRLVLGLPGNPASAFVCAHLLLKPLLHALLGRAEADRPLFAALTRDLPEGGSREVYWRARLGADAGGRLRVEPDMRLDSSLQTPLAAANALLRRRACRPPPRETSSKRC